MAMNRKAVFLDKDGTLIEDVPYNVDPEKIRFCSGVLAGLQLLHTAHYQLIVITNQAGIAHGYFSEADLLLVEHRLKELLATVNVPLHGFYYCPHHPQGVIPAYTQACNCRKPRAGLLLKAAQELRIELTQSWFIGDILNDIEAGRLARCRTVLIDNGNETEWQMLPQRYPHHIVADFYTAAQVILTVDQKII
jgi:D,D-heptose 1,7-bisphosphate phosphatase